MASTRTRSTLERRDIFNGHILFTSTSGMLGMVFISELRLRARLRRAQTVVRTAEWPRGCGKALTFGCLVSTGQSLSRPCGHLVSRRPVGLRDIARHSCEWLQVGGHDRGTRPLHRSVYKVRFFGVVDSQFYVLWINVGRW